MSTRGFPAPELRIQRTAIGAAVFLAMMILEYLPVASLSAPLIPGVPRAKTPGQPYKIIIDGDGPGRRFDGIGGVSAGASSRLLFDYSDPFRGDILDFLFKPRFGAGFQHLKVEIGGGENSTCGSEPSHAITREELKNPVDRGYELWLMSEARKRNPRMILDCLPWCYPGWISGVFSEDAADWFAAFLDAAKKHYHLEVDWIAAAMNENGTDRNWIVNHLRPTLDSKGYGGVKLLAPDDDSEFWEIFPALAFDPDYDKAVDAVGYHYVNGRDPWEIDQISGREATAEARNSGKPLWASEDWSLSGKDWGGKGALFLARLINKFYIRDRITTMLIWCPIDSIYKGLPWEETGAMSADRPWSGHYKVWPAVWALAHTTQFAEPGWRYLDGACGQFASNTWKGTFVTLKDPVTRDWSLIICTDTETEIDVRLTQGLKAGPIHVWHSDPVRQFIRETTLRPVQGVFSFALKPDSVYTFTTTTGQTKGSRNIPDDKPFPFPYQEDYESYQAGAIPKYHSDQKGSFEVAEMPGHGKYLKQIVPKQGHLWQYMIDVLKPYTVLGDQDWRDYGVSADVYVGRGDVEVGGRYGDQNNLSYRLILDKAGQWKLNYQKMVLALGTIDGFDGSVWHSLELVMRGDVIWALIDGREVASVRDSSRSSGMAFLASTYDPNGFDNLMIHEAK